MQQADEESLSAGGRRPKVWLAMGLTAAALVVSGYLSYVSLMAGESPAGCGAGSGCAEVLSSKWSRVLGIPVSLLAVFAYLDVMFALWMDGWGKEWARGLARCALTIWSAVIVGSAAWFVYLQVFKLGAVCPYCMAGHGLGVALVVTLVYQHRLRHYKLGWVGLAGVVLMAVLQMNSTTAVTTLENTVESQLTDQADDDQRTVTLLNGQLKLDPDGEPLLGSADAKHLMALMFDYACPHCRHTHGVLEQVRVAYPKWIAVVAMPMPMNPACNEHVPGDVGARFAESCELARIALAVYYADRAVFPGFDQWMYEPAVARTAEQARSEAIRRVGAVAYEQAYADPRTERMMARNVHAYGLSGADRVPVLVMPAGHASAAVVGRVDEVDQVVNWLKSPVGGESQ